MTKAEKNFVRSIQKDTLFWIVRGLRTKSSSQAHVKRLAASILEATRKPTLEECFDALYAASEEFWEANDVYVKNARMYYFIVDQGKLEKGRVKINEKNFRF